MPTKSTARMPALSAGLCRNEEAIGPHNRNTTPPAATRPTTIHRSCVVGRLIGQRLSIVDGAETQSAAGARDSPAIVSSGDERSPRRSRIRRNDVDAVSRLSFGLQAERAHVHARGPDVLLEQVLADVDAAQIGRADV